MNPYASLRGLPRDVWVLCAATFVNRMGAMAAQFLALYCTQFLHVSPGRAGLALGVYGTGMVLSAPLGGWLSDRFSARRVFAASLAGAGVLMLLFPLLRAWPLVLVGAFVWALVAEAGRPSSMAVLTTAAPPEAMRQATAAFRLALNLGMSIGPPLGGVLASLSFLALFGVDGATSLAACALVLWGLRPGRWGPAGRPARTPGPPLWRDRTLVAFCVGFALVWMGFVQQFGPLSVHLVQGLGHSTRLYGALVALNTLLIVTCEVPLLARLRHLSYARLFVAGGVLVALALLLIALDRLSAIGAGIAVGAFGEMCFMGAAMPFLAALAPEGRHGAYMGAYSLAMGGAMMVAPALGTAALGWVPAPLVWTCGAVVTLLGTAVLVQTARSRAAMARVEAPLGAG